MILADILFKQGFGTRYDCRSIAASGAVSIDGRGLGEGCSGLYPITCSLQ